MIIRADSAHIPLADESVHLIVTSPPYNLGKDYGSKRDDVTYDEFHRWFSGVMNEMHRVLVPGGRLCLNIPLDINLQFVKGKKQSSKLPFYHHVLWYALANTGPASTHSYLTWLYNTSIIWWEGNTSKLTAWGSWLSPSDPWVNCAAEMIVVLSKETRKRKVPYIYEHDIYQREFLQWVKGLWVFPGESAKRIGHPAPFPVELPYRCMKLYSLTTDTVLDPFCGSGTTGVAAKATGRNFIGLDLSHEFCNMAARRIESEVWVRKPQ